MFKASVAIPYD